MTPAEYAILFGDTTDIADRPNTHGIAVAVSELRARTAADDITVVPDTTSRPRPTIQFDMAARATRPTHTKKPRTTRRRQRNPFLWALLTGGVAVVLVLGLIQFQTTNPEPPKLVDLTEVIYPAVSTGSE